MTKRTQIPHTILFLFLIFGSCKTVDLIEKKQTLEFDSFTIETPISWTKIKVQGIDAYIGKIAIHGRDTIEFNLGFFANSLEQYGPDDYEGNNPTKFYKSKILLTSINGRQAKVLMPKKSGIGMTGVYFDNLKKVEDDIVKFNLVGENLNKTNEKAVLKAIRTIQFQL